MQGYFITVVSALFCVFSRGCLNIIDRSVLSRENVDFLKSMVCNALYPLIFAVGFLFVFGAFDKSIFTWILEPGMILSGLGAQLAGTAFSVCLKSMRIRNVMVASKGCDLLIPILVSIVAQSMNFQDYAISNLTTLAFFPIALNVFKNREFSIRLSILLAASLLFQAGINSYFQMSNFALNWSQFFKMIVCVLIWRTIFISLPLFWRIPGVIKKPVIPFKITLVLICRGLLAFLSQAAFFLSITRDKGFMAWPILNAGPLLSCYMADWFLNEKTGGPEKKSLIFLTIIFFGFVMKRSFL